MSDKYKISVIIPVYNVRDYLRECINSIVKQTIGFDNIQIIFINDGSPDDSGSICRSFAEKNVLNVIYLEQNNSGVSAARNRGIELAEGTLTTFLDADDKWSSDAFEIAYNSYLQHPEIAVISCRMCFFDSVTGDHQLNYKYDTDRIADISCDYNVPQLSSSSVFIKTEVVKEYRYLEGQKYSEDFRFINEILLDYRKMLLLKQPIYWYRKRGSESSAMQNAPADSDYYVKTCRDIYQYLFEKSIGKYGYVLRYLQFCVMYDLRWRLKLPLEDCCLTKSQKLEYTDIIKTLLIQIDDDIILEQRRIALALKLYALELKHNECATDSLKADSEGVIRYKDYPVFDFSKNTTLYIDLVQLQSNNVIISGQVNFPFSESLFHLSYAINGTQKEISLFKTESNIKTYFNGVLKSNLGFKISEPIMSFPYTLSFNIEYDNLNYVVKPKFRTSTRLDKKKGILRLGRIFLYRTGSSIVIAPYSTLRFLYHMFLH